MLGYIPSGLQSFLSPLTGLDFSTQISLFSAAVSIALVGYMESMTIATTGTTATTASCLTAPIHSEPVR